jgi:hypothetical protein
LFGDEVFELFVLFAGLIEFCELDGKFFDLYFVGVAVEFNPLEVFEPASERIYLNL